jgi:hypothetical protein
MIASLIQDIRYALRSRRKSPGSAMTAGAVLKAGPEGGYSALYGGRRKCAAPAPAEPMQAPRSE